MTILKTIEITVYRGKIEPIVEQRQCKILLYENHLEYIYDYDYKTIEGKTEDLICAAFIPKPHISIELTQATSDNDPELESVPMIQLRYNGVTERVYMEDMDKAEKLYTVIKRWLIS